MDATDAKPTGMLSNLTVLDLTRVRSGPTCVRQMADWGANVIKIESPAALGASTMGGARNGPDFQNLHRNKRSITLNLKTPEGIEIFKRMASEADVIVENYRPGVKKRLGIDYDTLQLLNPRLVYVSISGFGQDGPFADRPGFDQIAQGMGGLMSITGEPGAGPMRVGIPVADLCAGLLAAQGALLALLDRERTGKGQWVQTSLLQAQVFMLDFQAARWLMDEDIPVQAGNNHPTSMPTGVYETADGYMNIACSGDVMWERLKDLLKDERLQSEEFSDGHLRSENRTGLNAVINECTRQQTAAQWIEAMNSAGIPCGEINTIDKVFANPQVQHLGLRGDTHVVGQPLIMSAAESAISRPPPLQGQHTSEVLAEFGYDAEAVSGFADKGIT